MKQLFPFLIAREDRDEEGPAFRFPTREEFEWFGREMLGSPEKAKALMRRYFTEDEIKELHAALAEVE